MMDGVVVNVIKTREGLAFSVYRSGQAHGKTWAPFESLPDIFKEPLSILLLAFSDKMFAGKRFRGYIPEVGNILSLGANRAWFGFENILYDRKTKTFVDTREK